MYFLHGSRACFNKHDGPSDRATDHPPMLFVHCRMVRRPVGRPSCLLKHPPGSHGSQNLESQGYSRKIKSCKVRESYNYELSGKSEKALVLSFLLDLVLPDLVLPNLVRPP